MSILSQYIYTYIIFFNGVLIQNHKNGQADESDKQNSPHHNVLRHKHRPRDYAILHIERSRQIANTSRDKLELAITALQHDKEQ